MTHNYKAVLADLPELLPNSSAYHPIDFLNWVTRNFITIRAALELADRMEWRTWGARDELSFFAKYGDVIPDDTKVQNAFLVCIERNCDPWRTTDPILQTALDKGDADKVMARISELEKLYAGRRFISTTHDIQPPKES
jgi:hypothetical protein